MRNPVLSGGRARRIALTLATGLTALCLTLPALAIDTGGGGGTSSGGSSSSGSSSHSSSSSNNMMPAPTMHPAKPAARLIDSFISTPPRSLQPALSAAAAPPRPSFTQLA